MVEFDCSIRCARVTETNIEHQPTDSWAMCITFSECFHFFDWKNSKDSELFSWFSTENFIFVVNFCKNSEINSSKFVFFLGKII